MLQKLPTSIAILIVLIGGILIFGIYNLLAIKTAKVRVGKAEFKVELADNPVKQKRGLTGRKDLAENQGMLFVFPQSTTQTFWMKDMQFPVDIVWIDQDRVVGVIANLPPDNGENLYTSPTAVNYVLEIPAGVAAKNGISIGQNFELIK